jgi:hypothetical protein
MNNMNEIRKDVIGYEGIYSVSNLGRVKKNRGKRNSTEFIIKPWQVARGYLAIRLYKNGSGTSVKVHKLVASAFLGQRPEGMQINHKDPRTGKTDNRASNLEYLTPKGNMQHAKEHGLLNPPKGERHGSKTHPDSTPRGEKNGHAKIKDAEIPRIFQLRRQGYLLREIGVIVGLSQQQICTILKGRSRKQSEVPNV